MRRLLPILTASALTIPLALTGPLGGVSASAASATTISAATVAGQAPYTVRTLHFKVHIGPQRQQTCDIVGDLYTPRKATRRHRVPAILTTNGFGGSKDDQAGIGKAGASRGYVVLSYSGLGFGGSGCQVTLDDPDFDGVAASELVSFLGGVKGIAFKDAKHSQPAPIFRVVKRDRRNHLGRHQVHDPRVGMVGGSYGGQVQFAAASVDPRIDTIVPIITWNDLSYSLGPNNTSQVAGRFAVRTSTPGATKLTWSLLFTVLGISDGLKNAPTDPTRLFPCPNFATFVCSALVTAGTTGYFDNASVQHLQHASVTTYMKKIRIPTLLMQGQGDTLFNLNEAAATYAALKKQGTPVKMIWQSWGHSDSTPAPGEIDLSNPRPAKQYETGRIFNWFSHYLKGTRTKTGPAFAWFRDWVAYKGNAAPAYATSKSFPVGAVRSFYLSGSSLVSSARAITPGSQTFLTTSAGLPTSFNALDALGSYVTIPVPEADLPGTSLQWTGAALTAPLDVVGSPRLRLKVSAPLAAASTTAGPAGDLVMFVRMQDVGPDGKAQDIHDLTAPVRVPDLSKPFTVTLPAFVHRFAKGHRLRLVIAGGSLNYRGGLVSNPVTITTGSAGQVLTLPVTR